MDNQVVARIAAKMAIPFILLFGCYVIAHGELGPGGGFQGGSILACAFILYCMIFGVERGQQALPAVVVDIGAAAGVLFYSGVGVYSVVRGYNFLDYTALKPQSLADAESWGMTLVEYGVGVTVAFVMITIFNKVAKAYVPNEVEAS